jgi:transposase
VTEGQVELAFVDQGYTGEQPAAAAQAKGIRLDVVKRPEARKGFVRLPRRWVVERFFAWTARFRRLARDYERLPGTLAGNACRERLPGTLAGNASRAALRRFCLSDAHAHREPLGLSA